MQVNRKLKKTGGGGNSVPRAPVVATIKTFEVKTSNELVVMKIF